MATRQDTALLTRSVHVLEALAGADQPATLPTLAVRLGVSTSQTYRALRALQREGFVDHVGRRGYRLGTRALGLGVVLGPRPELRALARPVLTRLAARTSLTTRLHVRSGSDRVLVLVALSAVEPDLPTQTVIGERSRLTRGCSGRAILAHLDAAEIDEALAGEEGSGGAARRELARIRHDGYAVSHAGNHVGRRGIAAPLLPGDGAGPLGAVSLSAEEHRIDEAGLRALAGTLTVAARELAPALGTVLGPTATRPATALDLPPN